jgi:hypothetical protein
MNLPPVIDALLSRVAKLEARFAALEEKAAQEPPKKSSKKP